VDMFDAAGGIHTQHGVYRELTRPSRLVFTWTCPDLGVLESVVTVELKAAGDHTDLVLTHVLPPDPKIHREHEGGWNGCVATLERWLATQH
jgi:uncharacterized protein YndB with AHSA1/START domain